MVKCQRGEEKINLKNLYKIFRYTKTHGLVSMQFLGVVGTFFGAGIKESKNAITELYKNLSYATLSGANNFNFDAITDLVGRLSFSIKKAKKAEEIIDTTTFVEVPDPCEQEIVDDLLKDLENKKTNHRYVEPQVNDAQTIETETQTTNSEFSSLRQEFVKVNNAATEQKSQTVAFKLIDDILDEYNLFDNVDTEDIWREDDIFDNDDTQAIKNISKEIIDVAESTKTITVTDDNDEFNPIEIIANEDNIDIPSDDGIAIGAIKKVKIITANSNQLRLASNRIEKQYLRQKSKGILKNGK